MGGAFKWPSLQSVMEYRAKVKNVVSKVIETAPLNLPIHHTHPWVCQENLEISDCISYNILHGEDYYYIYDTKMFNRSNSCSVEIIVVMCISVRVVATPYVGLDLEDFGGSKHS